MSTAGSLHRIFHSQYCTPAFSSPQSHPFCSPLPSPSPGYQGGRSGEAGGDQAHDAPPRRGAYAKDPGRSEGGGGGGTTGDRSLIAKSPVDPTCRVWARGGQAEQAGKWFRGRPPCFCRWGRLSFSFSCCVAWCFELVCFGCEHATAAPVLRICVRMMHDPPR